MRYLKTFNEKITFNDSFWKWFDGSKVIDENGKPLICYHGTQAEEDFDEFYGDRGVAWFTPDYKYASGYIRDYGRVMSFYLSIKNPYILTISPQQEMTLDDFINKTNIETTRKYYIKNKNETRPVWDWYDPTHTNFLENLEKLGYDGMKTIEYDKYECWLVFDQIQIKKISNKI